MLGSTVQRYQALMTRERVVEWIADQENYLKKTNIGYLTNLHTSSCEFGAIDDQGEGGGMDR